MANKKITSEVRDIILKVKEFMDLEKHMQTPIIPLNRVNVRVAAATGVSERTVLNITKQARLIEQGLLDPADLNKPKKRVRTKAKKSDISEYELSVIHAKINEFYTFKKEVPTVNKLLNILQQEINFKGSRETLRKILRKNGLQFRKTKNLKEKQEQPPPPPQPQALPPQQQPPHHQQQLQLHHHMEKPMAPPPIIHNLQQLHPINTGMGPVVTHIRMDMDIHHTVFGHKNLQPHN